MPCLRLLAQPRAFFLQVVLQRVVSVDKPSARPLDGADLSFLAPPANLGWREVRVLAHVPHRDLAGEGLDPALWQAGGGTLRLACSVHLSFSAVPTSPLSLLGVGSCQCSAVLKVLSGPSPSRPRLRAFALYWGTRKGMKNWCSRERERGGGSACALRRADEHLIGSATDDLRESLALAEGELRRAVEFRVEG